MIKYTISTESKHWPARLKRLNQVILRIIRYKKNLKFEDSIDYTCNFILVDNREIRRINLKYRKINKPTDVLTFVSELKIKNQKIKKICDIFVSAEMVKLDAIKDKKNFYDHITHIIIHSFLHINGFIHNKLNDFKKMQNIEIKVLKNLGIDNPY